MRSTFLGFTSSTSGLFASQRSLDTVGHNIANVNTPGYTRQRVDQTNARGLPMGYGQGMLGTGVNMTGIDQMRSEFLDLRYRSEANAYKHWETRRDGLAFIEAMFNEPSDTGINTVMDQFFESLHELSKEPNVDELTHRALVLDRATAVTTSINHQYNQLESMVRDLNFDIRNVVSKINSIAEQIADLNFQIHRFEGDGSKANDLRDQRNLLVDELSGYVNVEILEVADPNDLSERAQRGDMPKRFVVQINGNPLVYHNRAYSVDVSELEKSEFFDDMGIDLLINKVTWQDGTNLDIRNMRGELKALLDLRDGSTPTNKGVPYYIQRLNDFTRTFAREMNQVARSGYGLQGQIHPDYGNTTNGAGYLFFTANGRNSGSMYDAQGNIQHQRINAQNIGMALEMTDLNKIPAAASLDKLPGDASVIMDMLALRNKNTMFAEGRPEDFLKTMISNLGVDMQESRRNAANQELLRDQVDNERMRISGVSIDEELTQMVRFQHAYNASARMITTMDEMIDVVINRMGLVGR